MVTTIRDVINYWKRPDIETSGTAEERQALIDELERIAAKVGDSWAPA